MAKKEKGFRRRRLQITDNLSKENNRPKKYKQWTERQMLDVMDSATIGCMPANKAAAKHGVPPLL